MPARVTYWTGTWDPDKEAISKEIVSLRTGSRATAPVVAFSSGHSSRLRLGSRVLCLSDRRWLFLRAVAALVESTGQVTHVFGGRASWHLLRSLGRRPILLTAVVAHEGSAPLPTSNLARVVVETDDAVDEWVRAGIAPDRVRVQRPGIDLDRYRRSPPPMSGRFRLLFASTPSDPLEFEARGIPLLVALARLRPDVDVVLPWRQWGDVRKARRAIERLGPPPNFVVLHEETADMREHFARAHATVAMFARGVGKACPNSVVEGFASGRPAIVASDGSLSALIEASGAGVVSNRDARALSVAVDRLRAGWPAYAERARRLAEAQFDLRAFRSRYEQLYEEIAYEARVPPGARVR